MRLHLARAQVKRAAICWHACCGGSAFYFQLVWLGSNWGLIRKGSSPVYALWHVHLSHGAGKHILHALNASRLLKAGLPDESISKHFHPTIHLSQGCKTFSSHSTQSTHANICRARTHWKLSTSAVNSLEKLLPIKTVLHAWCGHLAKAHSPAAANGSLLCPTASITSHI